MTFAPGLTPCSKHGMSGAMAAIAVVPQISPTREILDESAWLARRAAHVDRVRLWTEPYRRRASRGEKHPVHDFLWEYYSLRPSLLERWHPGIGVVVTGAAADAFLGWPEYARTSHGVAATVAAGSLRRLDSVRWIRDLLSACATRHAFFRCYGLHEWAMVYRASDVRHPAMPLRYTRQELAAIVDALPVRCSHFDAFRFFTAEARPLNRLQPASDSRLELEQRGCVHVTMDLYKWAYKLTPFVPSELVADCFELAVDARELDMRASPYDLSKFGFTSVPIETPEGRNEYEGAQRALSERATPLRTRLLAVCEHILTDGVGAPQRSTGFAFQTLPISSE